MSDESTPTGQRAIIVPPGKNGDHFGEGVYTLVCEDGEVLASHFCSAAGFAPGDLYEHRPERQPMFDAKGITGFVWLADSGVTLAELQKRNAAFSAAADAAAEAQPVPPTPDPASSPPLV